MNTDIRRSRERIALNVRKAMLEANLTQADLAEKLGVSRGTIGARVGAKKPFTTDELGYIAEITKIPFSQLVQIQDKTIGTA